MRRNPILLPLLIVGIASSASIATAAMPQAGDSQVQIIVPDMCCQGCAQKVSGQLYTVRGVKSVAVDLPTHTVTVSVPVQGTATLGQLWQSVQAGERNPTKLVTADATYELQPPQPGQTAGQRFTITIDNLHCMGCAQKIAAQLYPLKGVTKVSADVARNTLVVETRPGTAVSPWLALEAVARAKERPLAVAGNYGTLAVEWSTPSATKNHQPVAN